MQRLRLMTPYALLACFVALLTAAAFLPGCGGAPALATGVVNGGSVVLVETDRLVAVEYRRAAQEALEASQSLSEYRVALEPYDDVEAGLRAAAATLDVLSDLIEVWDELAEGEFRAALRLALEAFEGLLAVLRIAGVEPPESLTDFLATPTGDL